MDLQMLPQEHFIYPHQWEYREIAHARTEYSFDSLANELSELAHS